MTDVTDVPGASEDAPGDTADARPGRGRTMVAPFAALAIAVVMIGLVVLLIGAEPDDGAQTAETPWMNQPAPEAVGELGDGTPFDLARRKGSWVVLNFFQSDCVPCQREHPELVQFVEQQRALGPEGAEFYSVVFGDTRARVDRFFDERGGDWPVVYSDGDVIPASFGVNLVPETWIIDPDGVVRFRAISTVTSEDLSITLQQLREALGR